MSTTWFRAFRADPGLPESMHHSNDRRQLPSRPARTRSPTYRVRSLVVLFLVVPLGAAYPPFNQPWFQW